MLGDVVTLVGHQSWGWTPTATGLSGLRDTPNSGTQHTTSTAASARLCSSVKMQAIPTPDSGATTAAPHSVPLWSVDPDGWVACVSRGRVHLWCPQAAAPHDATGDSEPLGGADACSLPQSVGRVKGRPTFSHLDATIMSRWPQSHTTSPLDRARGTNMSPTCTASIMLGPVRLPSFGPIMTRGSVATEAPTKQGFVHGAVNGWGAAGLGKGVNLDDADVELSPDDSDTRVGGEETSVSDHGKRRRTIWLGIGDNPGVCFGDDQSPAVQIRGYDDGSVTAVLPYGATTPFPAVPTSMASSSPVMCFAAMSRANSLQRCDILLWL